MVRCFSVLANPDMLKSHKSHPLNQAEITRLLMKLNTGDKAAKDRLFECVYHELRQQASAQLRHERCGHTLQTTDLVHEAYLKLVDQKQAQWQNRAHFFSIAALAMRRILVDYARGHQAAKRGGGQPKISLDEAANLPEGRSEEMVALDEALTRLTAIDKRQGRIVELRFFGGLTIEETAQLLALSAATVKREWNMAKAWLYREMRQALATSS
jgi:RNA polymerase sigma factor (TIGR02999 family)